MDINKDIRKEIEKNKQLEKMKKIEETTRILVDLLFEDLEDAHGNIEISVSPGKSDIRISPKQIFIFKKYTLNKKERYTRRILKKYEN